MSPPLTAPGSTSTLRVVSLVPSLTETVFALGVGDRLVGRTRFCGRPAAARALPAVGGTKDPDLAQVLGLRPDLVLANQEENREEDVAALEARGIRVWVTYPRTVEDSIDLVGELGRRLGAVAAAGVIAADARAALDEARKTAVQGTAPRVVYLVWQRPYRGVSGDTYIDALLRVAGAVNPFVAHPERYPELSADEIRAAEPDALLLPSEPFHFRERHRKDLLEIGLAPRAKLVDGEPFCWWGARTAAGLRLATRVVAEIRDEIDAARR